MMGSFWARVQTRLLVGAVGVGAFVLLAVLATMLGRAHGTIRQLEGEKSAAVEVGAMLIRWADLTCEAAGVVFRPDGAKPDEWGQACLGRVRHLVRFEDEAVRKSQAAMLEAMAEQQRKREADAAAARRAEAKRRAAKRNMESVNAQVQNDEVGGDWFAHLNQLGGLLRPGEAAEERGAAGADGAGGADPGDAAGGAHDLPRPD